MTQVTLLYCTKLNSTGYYTKLSLLLSKYRPTGSRADNPRSDAVTEALVSFDFEYYINISTLQHSNAYTSNTIMFSNSNKPSTLHALCGPLGYSIGSQLLQPSKRGSGLSRVMRRGSDN